MVMDFHSLDFMWSSVTNLMVCSRGTEKPQDYSVAAGNISELLNKLINK